MSKAEHPMVVTEQDNLLVLLAGQSVEGRARLRLQLRRNVHIKEIPGVKTQSEFVGRKSLANPCPIVNIPCPAILIG